MILEKTDSKLELLQNNDEDVIYLEGVFTEFNVRNRNNRIYSAEDFLPKLEALRPRIKNHTLLGELDHPSNFDVSLSNASHVIEDLQYDRENNRIIGRIRLLNTRAGKDAQALVRDGIPLHISSRAAGNIDAAGHVTLTSLFTYDLVADPGFEDAQLHRVNESYTFDGCKESQEKCLNEQLGFSNNPNVKVYELNENEYNNIVNMENQGNLLTVENFQRYSEYIAEVLNGVKSSVSELTEKLNAVGGNADTKLSERVEKLSRYANYLAEQIELSHKHGDYLAEQIENTQNHNNYLAEQLENTVRYSEYLGENLNNNIKYSTYLAENIDKGFAHNDYLAEQLENNFKHNDYLAEQLENNFKHNDYLAEQLEMNYAHNDYLAEKLNINFQHNDYLAEQLENGINGNLINEGKGNEGGAQQINEGSAQQNNEGGTQQINEGKQQPTQKKDANEDYKNAINEKLDALLNSVKESVTETNFLNLISEARQNEFASLDDNTQKMITEAMNKAAVKNEAQANVVWKNVYESKKGLDIVENMPDVFKEKWNGLSQERKDEILNEAKFYDIKTQESIDKFWGTRDLRERQIATKRVDTDSAKLWENKEQDSHMANILNRTKRNIQGF